MHSKILKIFSKGDHFDYDKTIENDLLQLKDLFRGKSKEEQRNILLTFKKL